MQLHTVGSYICSSNDGRMMIERNETYIAMTFMFDYANDRSVITFYISITVVDINGQRSDSSVIERSISDMISSKYIYNYISSYQSYTLHTLT